MFNGCTVRDRYLLPRLHEFAQHLAGTTQYTKIDLTDSYGHHFVRTRRPLATFSRGCFVLVNCNNFGPNFSNAFAGLYNQAHVTATILPQPVVSDLASGSSSPNGLASAFDVTRQTSQHILNLLCCHIQFRKDGFITHI